METLLTTQPPRTIREVYDALPEGTLAQLISSQLVMAPAHTYGHQKILNIINRKIADYVEQKGLGEIIISPFDVHLDEENIFQPDIQFLRKDQLPKIQKDGFHGAPALVIELLSPGTARYDLQQKKDVYERSGVQEYFIVDPDTREVEGYFLENGKYGKVSQTKGTISSRLLEKDFQF